MIILTSMFSAALEVQSESNTSSVVVEDGRYILARLSYDIQRADAVTTPATIGATTTSMGLTISAVANTYAISGGNLQLTNGSGTSNLNGNGTTISALSVQRIGNAGGKDTIRLSVTVTSIGRDNQGQEVQTFTTTVGRR
jgi:hypothetical protein